MYIDPAKAATLSAEPTPNPPPLDAFTDDVIFGFV
jgi:hypothetical protein